MAAMDKTIEQVDSGYQLLCEDTTESQQQLSRESRLKKLLLVALAIVITFVLVVVFVITSSTIFTVDILPSDTYSGKVERLCPQGMKWLDSVKQCQEQPGYQVSHHNPCSA